MPLYVVDQVLRAKPRLGRQSSRLDEVVCGGQQATQTGVASYAAQQAREQRDRANRATSVSKGQDDYQVEAMESIKQSQAAAQERQKELAFEKKETDDAQERQDAREEERRRKAATSLAERQRQEREDFTAKAAYRDLATGADVEIRANMSAKYYEFFNDANKRYLSPKETTDYMEKLMKVNDYLLQVESIENLSEVTKNEEARRVRQNVKKVAKLRAYLPKIERAFDAEAGMDGKSMAEKRAELNAMLAARAAGLKTFEAEKKAELEAMKSDNVRNLPHVQALERELEMAKTEAAMKDAQMQKTSEEGMATLQERLRKMEDEMAKAKARADAAEQAAEKCDSMLAKGAQASTLTEETYQGLQMDVAQKKAVHEINSQKADKTKGVLKSLESQLEDAMAQAKATYNDYVTWEREKECSGRWLFRNKSCDDVRRDYLVNIAATKTRVAKLTNQVEAVRKERDAFFQAFLRSYTAQEVAVAVMEAAKQHMGKKNSPLPVVLGKPV
jgi:hypothetical protein